MLADGGTCLSDLAGRREPSPPTAPRSSPTLSASSPSSALPAWLTTPSPSAVTTELATRRLNGHHDGVLLMQGFALLTPRILPAQQTASRSRSRPAASMLSITQNAVESDATVAPSRAARSVARSRAWELGAGTTGPGGAGFRRDARGRALAQAGRDRDVQRRLRPSCCATSTDRARRWPACCATETRARTPPPTT